MSKELMKRSSQRLKDIARIIDVGQAGKKVILPIVEASLSLRISEERLRGLGYGRLELVMSGDNLIVSLRGSETSRKQAYLFLYGLVQNLDRPAVLVRFLRKNEIPEELKNTIEDFEEIVEVAKKAALTEEDCRLLGLETYCFWLSLRDKSGLPDPLKVMTDRY